MTDWEAGYRAKIFRDGKAEYDWTVVRIELEDDEDDDVICLVKDGFRVLKEVRRSTLERWQSL